MCHPDGIEAARRTGYARYLVLCDPEHLEYRPEALKHARAALAASPPVVTVPTNAAPEPSRPRCDYRDSCPCHGPVPICHHREHGPARGRRDDPAEGSSIPRWRVDDAACRGCPEQPPASLGG